MRQPPASQLYVLHNEQVCPGEGLGLWRGSQNSDVHVQQVWTCREEGLCIMGNGHMVPAPSVDRQTDTIENITFATPLVGGNYILSFC